MGEAQSAEGRSFQCGASGGDASSNLRIVSGGIRSLPAISSAVGSRPITCRRFRQVRTILLKAAMVATEKLPAIIIPRSCPKYDLTRHDEQAPGLSAGLRCSQDTHGCLTTPTAASWDLAPHRWGPFTTSSLTWSMSRVWHVGFPAGLPAVNELRRAQGGSAAASDIGPILDRTDRDRYNILI